MHASVEASGEIVLVDAGAEKIGALGAFRFRGGDVLAHGGLMRFAAARSGRAGRRWNGVFAAYPE